MNGETTIMRCTEQPLHQIIPALSSALRELGGERGIVAIEALDPDVSSEHFAGESLELEGQRYAYRSWQVWQEVAEQLSCRLMTPVLLDPPLVRVRFQPLREADTWHLRARPSGDAEKYGADSTFFRIHKLEEPSFLVNYIECLKQLPLPDGARILNLGINRGDEWLPFASLWSPEQRATMHFTGVDHAASALAYGREAFRDVPGEHDWIEADLNAIVSDEGMELDQYDLIVSIGTLHSPKLRSRDIFCRLVRHHLTPQGHVIIGFPNCRYIDHNVRYGAKVKNYSRPELSVLWKEVAFHKRYLQQHKFRVTVTGKHTIFVTGRRLPR